MHFHFVLLAHNPSSTVAKTKHKIRVFGIIFRFFFFFARLETYKHLKTSELQKLGCLKSIKFIMHLFCVSSTSLDVKQKY